MKKLLTTMFVALLMVGCGEEVVNIDDLEHRRAQVYLPNEETPFTGRAESFYENGQKKSEGKYKDGKMDGLSTEWYENGQKKSESNWNPDTTKLFAYPVGLWTMWYENGQKKWEGNYKDGKLISAEVWKPNGEKCPDTNLKDGKGGYVEYNEDGTEKGWKPYKDGVKVD